MAADNDVFKAGLRTLSARTQGHHPTPMDAAIVYEASPASTDTPLDELCGQVIRYCWTNCGPTDATVSGEAAAGSPFGTVSISGSRPQRHVVSGMATAGVLIVDDEPLLPEAYAKDIRPERL